jgi:hypothetical protein
MSQVQVIHISSTADIPTGQKYVLVEYGSETAQRRDSFGVTITVPRNRPTSDLSFLANVHSAKEIAKREGIAAVYACEQ